MQMRHDDLQMSGGLTLLKIIIKNIATLPLGGRREAGTWKACDMQLPSPLLPTFLNPRSPLSPYRFTPLLWGDGCGHRLGRKGGRKFTETETSPERDSD